MSYKVLILNICMANLLFFTGNGNANDVYSELIFSPEVRNAHYSETPSGRVIFRYADPQDNSIATAEIRSSVIPYVQSSAYAVSINNLVSQTASLDGGTTIAALMYSFNIVGAPNSLMPIGFGALSTFSNATNVGVAGIGTPEAGSFAGSRNRLDLSIGNGNAVNISFSSDCGTNAVCQYEVNDRALNQGSNTLSLNYVGINENDSGITRFVEKMEQKLISSFETPFQFEKKDIFSGNFLIPLDETGRISGSVIISSESGASISGPLITVGDDVAAPFAYSESYIDPYFFIDPEYLLLHPNSTVSVFEGVGNENPLAAVPEPETYLMFIAGLGLVGLTSRRRNNKQFKI